MNLKVIYNALGKLLQVLALLMLLPLLVAFIYKESLNNKLNFIIPILVSGIIGSLMVKFGSEKGHIYTREAMFTTAFAGSCIL